MVRNEKYPGYADLLSITQAKRQHRNFLGIALQKVPTKLLYASQHISETRKTFNYRESPFSLTILSSEEH